MLHGASSSGPALKRSNSLPARLPSDPLEPAEVKTARKPTTRPSPDTRPPKEFRDAGGMRERVEAKQDYMEAIREKNPLGWWLNATIERSPEYCDAILTAHPRFRDYSDEQKRKAVKALLYSHPQLLAETAKWRNEMHGVPNSATSSREMKLFEQKFLAKAMQRILEDVEKRPFHIHGESGVLGNWYGGLTWFGHNPEGSIEIPMRPDDKYALHNHRPFMDPFMSSASETDHRVSTYSYLAFDNRMSEYVTDGKEVLHIQPDSLELVKMIPEPGLEERMGKFPEAFRLPEPQNPPRPFANHEAPAAFKDWKPPAGWTPPADYPRSRPAE
jgi:hypothetical protein